MNASNRVGDFVAKLDFFKIEYFYLDFNRWNRINGFHLVNVKRLTTQLSNTAKYEWPYKSSIYYFFQANILSICKPAHKFSKKQGKYEQFEKL